MKLTTKLTRTFGNVSRTVGKHSPLILTVAGVVGLGATAVFSYKASKKVEVIVDEMEEIQEAGLEFDRVDIGKKVIGAVALPVVTGALSITAIGLSYHIQNNRLGALAAALATSTAEQVFFKAKYEKEHGKEAAQQFYQPTEQVTRTIKNDDGKETDIVEDLRKEIPSTHGAWFDKSTEYASDDHAYNMQFIRTIEDSVQLKMFGTGWLRMNELFDRLGLERTRAGELLGWSAADDFNLDTIVTNTYNDATGEFEPQIYIKWSQPKYIYDNVDYTWS